MSLVGERSVADNGLAGRERGRRSFECGLGAAATGAGGGRPGRCAGGGECSYGSPPQAGPATILGSLALAAGSPTALVAVGVGAVKRVAVNTVRLTSMLCEHALSAQDIGAACDRLQVVGSHASAVAAEVIERQASWNWTDVPPIRPDVGADRGALSRIEAAIPVAPDAASPDPARSEIGVPGWHGTVRVHL